MTMHYRFTAKTLRTRSPLVVSQVTPTAHPSPNSPFLPPSNSLPDARLLRTVTETVPHMMRRDGLYAPYVPASSVKGTWRNIGTQIMLRGLDGQVPEDVVMWLATGGKILKADKRTESMTISDIINIDRGNPLLRIFGYNYPEFCGGFSSFSHMESEDVFTLGYDSFARAQPFRRNPNLYAALSEQGRADADEAQRVSNEDGNAQKGLKDNTRALDAELKKLRKEGASDVEIDEKIKELEAARNEQKAHDKARSVSMSQIGECWNIPVGVDFKMNFSGYMNQVELGLMLSILSEWGMDGSHVGGLRARGAGGDLLFDFVVEQRERRAGAKWETIGNITNMADDVEINGDILMAAVGEFHDALAEIQKVIPVLSKFGKTPVVGIIDEIDNTDTKAKTAKKTKKVREVIESLDASPEEA